MLDFHLLKEDQLIQRVLINLTEEDQWQTVARTDQGPMREYSVSYQNLMPSSSYTFRIVAYNKFGISYPVYTHDPVSLVFQKCFGIC
jgi:hypothetical protein